MQVKDALQLEADEPEEHSPFDERAIDGLGVVLAVRREDVVARAAVEQVFAYVTPIYVLRGVCAAAVAASALLHGEAWTRPAHHRSYHWCGAACRRGTFDSLDNPPRSRMHTRSA